MVEPIMMTSGAIAVATLILNKAFEKTGEKLGEAVSQQISRLWQLIRRKPLPKTAAIEQADQPVDFGQAVLEVETVAATDSELTQTLNDLATIVKADPALLKKLQNTAEAIEAEPTIIQNNAKLAEKIGMVVQGGTVNLDRMSF